MMLLFYYSFILKSNFNLAI